MKNTTKLELGIGLGCLFILIFLLREALLFGRATFAHDNFYWNLPIFHFFAESLLNGDLPLWNPYSQSGEPFYPALMQIRLLDPLNLISIFIGAFVTKNILLIYHWNRIFQSVFMLVGVYLNLRGVAKTLTVKMILISCLFFSSFMLGSFHADGVINNFLWAPWIFFFYNKIFNKGEFSPKYFLGLALAIGVNFQSYFFAMPILMVILLGVYQIGFRYNQTLGLVKTKQGLTGMVLTGAMLLMMSAPNVVLWKEQDRFVYPARLLPANYEQIPKAFGNPPYQAGAAEKGNSIKLPFSAIEYGGSFSSGWDYVQLLSPESNPWIYAFPEQVKNQFGRPSECFFYFGVLGYALILLGIFFGQHQYKRAVFILTAVFVLLSLGPVGKLHSVLYYFVPPLWFIRHLQFLVLYVTSGFLYFMVLGANELFSTTPKEWRERVKNRLNLVMILLLLHFCIIYIIHPNPLGFAVHFFVAFLLLLLIRGNHALSSGLLVTGLTLELGLNFIGASSLYEGIKTKNPPLNAKWNLAEPKPILARQLYPDYPIIRLWGSQRPRYLGNLYRESFIFSKVQRIPPEEQKFDLLSRSHWWDSLYVSKDYFEAMQSNLLSGETLGLGVPIYVMDLPGTLKIQNYQHNRISFSIDSSAEQKLLWRENYDSYWKVKVNGKPITLEKAQGTIKAFRVSKGLQDVVLEYLPIPFLMGVLSYYLAVAFTLLGLFNFARFFGFKNIVWYPKWILQRDTG